MKTSADLYASIKAKEKRIRRGQRRLFELDRGGWKVLRKRFLVDNVANVA